MVDTLTPDAEATPGTDEPATRRKRLPGTERRAQLLEVAISIFGQRGFRGATTKAIAEAAGVSEATIFRHFPSKTPPQTVKILILRGLHRVFGYRELFHAQFALGIPRTR